MQISEDENDKDAAGKTSARIKEGLSNLHTSLEALKSSAELLVEEEQKSIKRPRLETQPAEIAAPSAATELPGSGFG